MCWGMASNAQESVSGGILEQGLEYSGAYRCHCAPTPPFSEALVCFPALSIWATKYEMAVGALGARVCCGQCGRRLKTVGVAFIDS